MWKINDAPTLNEALSDIRDLISASQTKKDSSKRLDQTTDGPLLEALYTLYHKQRGSITAQQNSILTKQKRESIKELYSETYNHPNAKLSQIRQDLLSGVTHCPYCGFGEPTTLDHFLPKAKYGLLATCRLNLLPACRHCNSLKDENTQIPHPYYQNYPANAIFFVCLVHWTGNFYTFKFDIDPQHISLELATKLTELIKTINLSDRLCRELNSFIREEFRDVSKVPDNQIKTYIDRKVSYYASFVGNNHWKTAALRGLSVCNSLSVNNLRLHLGLGRTRDALI